MHQPFCETTLDVSLSEILCHLKSGPGPRTKKYILHIAVACMVTMASTDASCSPATLSTFEELDNVWSNTAAAGQPQYKRKGSHNALITSRSTAPSAVTVVPKPKRARFEPRRRQQVANVRKKGACMRCRIKKRPVGADACFWPKGLALTTAPVFRIISMHILRT